MRVFTPLGNCNGNYQILASQEAAAAAASTSFSRFASHQKQVTRGRPVSTSTSQYTRLLGWALSY